MRTVSTFFLFAVATVFCLAQQAEPIAEISTDPKALLNSVAPFYRLEDSAQHPWHLKATYQLYDNQGKPSEQGTYEFWWASPGKYRTTWSRKSVNASVWVDGEASAVFVGHPELLGFSEGLLGLALVHTVPAQDDIGRFGLSYVPLNLGGTLLRCVRLSPKPSLDNGGSMLALVPRFSGLCLDSGKPILRLLTSENGEMVIYGDLEPFDGQYLARQVSFDRGKLRKWDARIAEIEEIGADDLALIPPPKAKPLQASIPESNYPSLQLRINASNGSIERSIFNSEEVASDLLKNPIHPILPTGLDAKKFAHSKVVFQVIVSGSGKVRFARAISGPTELQKAALEALMQYEYRPVHTTNWEPLDIETKVTIQF